MLKRRADLEHRGGQYRSNSGSGSDTPGKREDAPAPPPDPHSESLVGPGVRARWLSLSTDVGKNPKDADKPQA